MKPICLRDKVKSRFFQLLLIFKTPRADPRTRQRSENPTPGTTRMCESPVGSRGRWLGLELTDTLFTLVDANYDGANF